MKYLFLFLLSFSLLHSEIAKEDWQQIGLKVWQNECKGTVDGLISWNSGEEFPSLGIGHFIWYPEGATKKFEETFPALVEFLNEKLKDTDQKIPSWIKSQKGFPWKTREEFLKDKRSKKMQQLRDLLSSTVDFQITFLFERFEMAEKKILPKLSIRQKNILEDLKKNPQGIYALIDYVNFKGIGLSESERYRGEGWGLLQVLQNIPDQTENEQILPAFIHSAKKVLTKRVKNAPSERKEERWLIGWHKRLETYGKTDH